MKNEQYPSFYEAVMAGFSSPRPLASLDRDHAERQEELRGKWPGFFSGIALPWGSPEARGMSAGSFHDGGSLIGSDHISVLGAIRNSLSLERLGAQMFVGLRGTTSIGYGSTKVTAEWLSETAEANQIDPKFDTLTLSPNRITAKFVVSRELLVQGPQCEPYLRNQAGAAISAEIERCAAAGLGANGEPVGILNVEGITVIDGGTNGAAPTWDHITDLEYAVPSEDSDDGTTGWLVSPLVRRKLRRTARNGTGSAMVWDGGPRELLGHPAGISLGIPDTLVKGSASNCSAIIHAAWSQFAVGVFGPGVDVVVNPFTRAQEGLVIITITLHVDCGVIDPKAFAVMKDALCA